MIYGLTVDNPWDSLKYAKDVADRFASEGIYPTVRIMWDPPGSEGMKESDFVYFVNSFSHFFPVMALPLDSQFMKELSYQDFYQRARIAAMTDAKYVECGNEIGGSWLGDDIEVQDKVQSAVTACLVRSKIPVVTWYLDGDEGFESIAQKKSKWWLKNDVTHFLSWYPNETPGRGPGESWEKIAETFDGIGEYGPNPKELNVKRRMEFVTKYETEMVSKFSKGGGFYWNASKDVFSKEAPLLQTFVDLWGTKKPVPKPKKRCWEFWK